MSVFPPLTFVGRRGSAARHMPWSVPSTPLGQLESPFPRCINSTKTEQRGGKGGAAAPAREVGARTTHDISKFVGRVLWRATNLEMRVLGLGRSCKQGQLLECEEP